MRGPHPGLLHLLEGSARVHALMLGGVSNHQNAVLGLDLFEEGPHLSGAGKAGLVQHVEMWAGSGGARVVLASGKETLQRRGFDSFLSKLTGCAGRGGETFDLVAVRFRAFADAGKHGCLAGSCESLNAVDAVAGREHIGDDASLGLV